MPRESIEMLDLIEREVPADQPKLRAYVGALRQSLEEAEREALASAEELAQYRAAYEKLTQPANRIGVFLKWIETEDSGRLGFILLGDSEYVVNVDPNLDQSALVLGVRVRLNEGYSIVGLAPSYELGGMAKVASLVGEDRLQVGGDQPGEGQRLIFRGSELAEVKVGDLVRLDATGRFALEVLDRPERNDYFVESIPETSWDQIGGQEKAIQLIRETIEYPLLHPEVFKAYGKKPIKGVLLYGPPGCGKTLIGKATAHNLAKEYSMRLGREVKECFLSVSGPKILNMWVGETERMVREIFSIARERAKEGQLVFIFLDEAESLLRTRSSGRYFSMSNTVVPQFCAELDGMAELDNVILMLTSNRPDYIDPAILRPGRIDRKVKIERPSEEACRQILSIYLQSSLPIDCELLSRYSDDEESAKEELINQTIDQLFKRQSSQEILTIYLRNGTHETLHRSDLISGAMLENIVDRAKDIAIRRTLETPGNRGGLKVEDLIEAVNSEFTENDILPKSDQLEDWLQLLDLDAESVVSVRSKLRNDSRKNSKFSGTLSTRGVV